MFRNTTIHRCRRGLRVGLILAGLTWIFFQGYSQAATYNLYADKTTKTMPDTGEVVTMWGFGLISYDIGAGLVTVNGPVTVPGPMLTVPAGDTTLTVTLRNNLTAANTGLPMGCPIALVVAGQNLPTGASAVRFTGMAPPYNLYNGRIRSFAQETPPNNTTIVTYTWNNLKPGTYIYHSSTHVQCHVQMGLYGGVKKDAVLNQVYANVNSAYDSEAIVFLSEIDPAFHAAVATNNYGPGKTMTSTINYRPKYFLVNGAPYSAAALPLNISGARVLLRFFNAGLQTHVPLLYGGGLYLKVLAENGNPYPYLKEQYTLTLPALGTADAIINPTTTGQYPLFDRRLNLTNASTAGGGMLAYLNYGAAGGPFALTVSKTLQNGSTGTVTSSPIGIDCGATCSFNFASGTVVTLSATPAAGSAFVGWSDPACPGTGNCLVTMNGPKTVTATFTGAYAISGQVTAGGVGLSGVTMTLSGAGTGTTLTDATGNYSFSGLTNGTYTVTPSQGTNTFTPTSLSPVIAGASATGQNFAATGFALSGTVNNSVPTGILGVTITLSGAASRTTTTAANGSYSFPNLLNGSYTVTPSLGTNTFTPANQAASINGANLPNQNFTINPWTISGTVTSGGVGVGGVTVTLSGAASGTTTTAANGTYSFPNLLNGNYTVTPTGVYTPASRNITIAGANQINQNFASTTYGISGRVTTSSGTGISGVTMTLSGAGTGTISTDVNGNYSFTGLSNGQYTVTPSRTGSTFTPTSRTLTINNAGFTGQNFTAGGYSISGRILDGITEQSLPGVLVTLTATGFPTQTFTTGSTGNFQFNGLPAGNYRVTPTKTGLTFIPLFRDVTITTFNRTGLEFKTPEAGAAARILRTPAPPSGGTTVTGTESPKKRSVRPRPVN